MVRKQCQCELHHCKCLVHHTGYRPLGPNRVVFTSRSLSLHRLLDQNNKSRHLYEVKEESETSLIEKTQRNLERFYDTCVGYNMRHCSFAGFMKNKHNYFKLTMTDVVVLICFLATNFVVFSTIIFNTLVHVFFLIVTSLQWILRAFIANVGSCRIGPFGHNRHWHPRTEELIRTLGLQDRYPPKYINKYSNVFTNT